MRSFQQLISLSLEQPGVAFPDHIPLCALAYDALQHIYARAQIPPEMGDWPSTTTSHTRWRKPALSPPVYSRDFAYANSSRILVAEPRMARPSIRDASASTFAELLAGPTVDIFVGAEKRHWTLHRNLLCHHSPYFETEFLGNELPKKGSPRENKLELLEDDPRGFELLVKWLYQGSLEDVMHLTDNEKYDHAVACHKLYLLCDKFDMVTLKNIAMDRYRRGLHEAQLVPDPEEINDIYRSSRAGSPFCKLMTKIAARQIMDPEVDKDAESYRRCFENNPDFAVEMVNAIRYSSRGMLFEDPTNGDLCEYHDHTNGENCNVKGKDKGTSRRATRLSQSGGKPPPRTPRKLRAPEASSPKSTRAVPRKLSVVNGVTPVPKEMPSGFAPPIAFQANGTGKASVAEDRDLSNAIDASRRYAANMSSPRKLPENRFHSIVKQLNRTNSTDGDSSQDAQSTAGSGDTRRATIKKQPRKISSMLAVHGGGQGTSGVG